jgi:hypothetical protein
MYGKTCVDLIDAYCLTIWKDWIHTIGAGDAKYLFDRASTKYFLKIKNDPKKVSQIPVKGDIIIWGTSNSVPEGHIAIVVSANTSNVTVIEQDGYTQCDTCKVSRGYILNGVLPIGWLRPKLIDDTKKSTATVKWATTTGVCKVRSAPKLSAPQSGSKLLNKGAKFQYTSIVTGNKVAGNNKWVKSTKGNFVWAGNLKY